MTTRKRRSSVSKVPAVPPSYYRSPAQILEHLGIDTPADIRLEAIAQTCGATILYEPLSGSDARILGYGDRAFITVNTQSSVPRQRFSAAHELGHWMWDRGKMAFSCGEKQFSGEQDEAERRANRYAAELLLPAAMFVPAAQGRRRDFHTIEDLAHEFHTSVVATAIRYVELMPIPMLLVCHEGQGRRWFSRGKLVPRELKPRDRLHPRTAAFSLLQGEISPLGLTEVDADRWIDHNEAARYSLHEDSIRIGAGQILSLLWWDEDGQLRAPAHFETSSYE